MQGKIERTYRRTCIKRSDVNHSPLRRVLSGNCNSVSVPHTVRTKPRGYIKHAFQSLTVSPTSLCAVLAFKIREARSIGKAFYSDIEHFRNCRPVAVKILSLESIQKRNRIIGLIFCHFCISIIKTVKQLYHLKNDNYSLFFICRIE